MSYYYGIVQKNVFISNNAKHLVIKLDQYFTFKPGQFVRSYKPIKEGKWEDRPYSIANLYVNDTVEVVFSIMPNGGIVSDYLHAKGEKVRLSGPFGTFILRENIYRTYFLLATGTGVTPYRSMLRLLSNIQTQNPIKVLLCFGTRTHGNVLFQEEFLDFVQKNPWFQYQVFYSKQLPSASYEHQGYVQHIFSEICPQAGDIVYLCGSPNMVDESEQLLKERGFSEIVREKYVFRKKIS